MAIRNLATIVYKLGGGKESIDNIWPLTGKERTTIAPMTRTQWDMIKEKQKVIDKQIMEARQKKK